MSKYFNVSVLVILILTSLPSYADSAFQTKKLSLVETSDESEKKITELVRDLSGVRGDAARSQKLGGDILLMVKNKVDISEYDYLWTLYALIIYSGPELEGGMSVKDYLRVTDTAMHYLDNNGVGEWVFTDIGQFKMEVYRQAANAAAWALRESKPKQALPYIDLGLGYARDEDNWMYDTKVRVLLNMDKKDDAYEIVKAVLDQDPNFSDFQDFISNEDYQTWLNAK